MTRAYVNGVPQTGVELREGVKSHAVGRNTHPAEQAFVAELVRASLAEARDAREAAARVSERRVIVDAPSIKHGDFVDEPSPRDEMRHVDGGKERTRARL